MRSIPQLTYPVIGALLGAGAPVGSFLLRFLAFASVRQQPLDDLRTNGFFYLYDFLATSLVFAIVGFIAGRHADRLRRGEAYYHDLTLSLACRTIVRSWTVISEHWSARLPHNSRWRSSSSTSTS